MLAALAHRPLAVAGLFAVAGALGAGRAPGAAVAAAGALLLLATTPRARPTALTAAAALAGGLAAGAREELRTERHLAAIRAARARAPPETRELVLRVERAGEDPFSGRSWLLGRAAGGAGALCGWPGPCPEGIGPGAVVRARGRSYLPRTPGNPAQRDPERAMAASGASLSLDAKSIENVTLLEPAPRSVAAWLSGARRGALRRLAAALPEDVAGIAAALFLGHRGGVPDEDRRLFERTGTIHILAISGMHVVFLAAFASAILRRAGAGPRLSAALTLLLAAAYVPLAGGEAPIRRAVFGMAFAALALARGRPPDFASALGGAALAIALLDPRDVGSVGFRLSFLATAGIAFLAVPWQARWSERHRLLARFPAVRSDRPIRLFLEGYLLRALPASIAASLVTAASVAHDFGRVSPWSPLTNLFVAPLVAAALPLIPAVALGADLLAGPLALLLRASRLVLAAADALPFGALSVVPPPPLAVAAFTGGAFLLRTGLPRASAPILLGLLLWSARRPEPETSLLLFDVGHGQAALLRFGDGSALLVDAGSRTQPDLARRVLLPALRKFGVARLRAVVCTHADADHWNALPELLAAIEIDALVTGPDAPRALLAAARARGVPHRVVVAGDAVAEADGASLRVAVAGEPEEGSANDRSVALVFEAFGRRVLLPADREEAGIETLLEHGVERADVLVAPHHGARCHAAAALGAAARPDWLLVSAAPGFADARTLRAYGAPRVLATERDGSVAVRFRPDGALLVEPFR